MCIGYRKVRESTKVIGVWDDHDYGVNNGASNFAKKDEVREIFLDFLDEP
jgi:alkaline phosphatase D